MNETLSIIYNVSGEHFNYIARKDFKSDCFIPSSHRFLILFFASINFPCVEAWCHDCVKFGYGKFNVYLYVNILDRI